MRDTGWFRSWMIDRSRSIRVFTESSAGRSITTAAGDDFLHLLYDRDGRRLLTVARSAKNWKMRRNGEVTSPDCGTRFIVGCFVDVITGAISCRPNYASIAHRDVVRISADDLGASVLLEARSRRSVRVSFQAGATAISFEPLAYMRMGRFDGPVAWRVGDEKIFITKIELDRKIREAEFDL